MATPCKGVLSCHSLAEELKWLREIFANRGESLHILLLATRGFMHPEMSWTVRRYCDYAGVYQSRRKSSHVFISGARIDALLRFPGHCGAKVIICEFCQSHGKPSHHVFSDERIHEP